MKLRVENGLGASLNLWNFFENTAENLFHMRVSPFVRRTGVKERFGKDGGRSLGDGRANPRKITLKYNNRSKPNSPRIESDRTYRAYLNRISSFFDPTLSPWYLYDDDSEIRCEIVMEQNADEPIGDGLSYVLGSNDLQFTMLDGHWEDAKEISFLESGSLVSGGSFQVTNDSDFYTWAVFVFTAINSNSEFTLNNLTTEESFTVSNVANTAGKVLEVDGTNGTVLLNGVESSISLSDGSGFISLAPGVNNFTYESLVGGQTLLEIKFRRRYAH